MNTRLSHLAYLELGSPDTAASATFSTEKFGLRVVDQDDDAYYLRCWGDHYHYSFVISPAPDGRLKTMAWRTTSEEALTNAVAQIETVGGVCGTWSEAGKSHGRAHSLEGPFGHEMTLVWEIDEFVAAPIAAAIPTSISTCCATRTSRR